MAAVDDTSALGRKRLALISDRRRAAKAGDRI